MVGCVESACVGMAAFGFVNFERDAAGSSQRPTAWATPGVVSPVVPSPRACRAGVAGVVEVGSRRVAQAGDAGVVPRACARLGTECGSRAAE